MRCCVQVLVDEISKSLDTLSRTAMLDAAGGFAQLRLPWLALGGGGSLLQPVSLGGSLDVTESDRRVAENARLMLTFLASRTSRALRDTTPESALSGLGGALETAAILREVAFEVLPEIAQRLQQPRIVPAPKKETVDSTPAPPPPLQQKTVRALPARTGASAPADSPPAVTTINRFIPPH